MDLDAYCARIGYDGPRAPTLEVLRALALRQPQAITFENVAVVAGGVPDVSLDAVTRKLVHGRRGGYCYEQNTLLQGALDALGFTVTALSARVRYGLPADFVDSRGHMILLVALPDGPYLVDAGFGGLTLTAPVALRWHDSQPTPHEVVRLVPAPAGPDHLAASREWRLQARFGDDWADVYQFDLSPHFARDFMSQNWFTATRPNALFANNLIVTRPVPGGRHTLFNRTLTWRPLGGSPQRREIADAAALATVLRDVFALAPPDAEITAAADVAARGAAHNASFA